MNRKIDQKSVIKGHFDYEHVVMGKSTNLSNDDYQKLIARDVRLQRLMEALPNAKGKMLDIGCGGGTITNCLAHKFSKLKLYGCDISSSAIAVAQATSHTQVEFSVMKNNKFPYKNEMFDICVCFDVLEHVPDPDKYLSETRRVLKKGGVIFFAIPCEGERFSLTWLLQKLKIGSHLTYKHVGHIHPEFTHQHIIELIKKQKFKVISLSYSEHFITQCVRFFRFILPKELLELVMGSNSAEKYYDRSIIQKSQTRERKDFFMIVRMIWLKLGMIFDAIENTETRIFKDSGFAAWKIFVFAERG